MVKLALLWHMHQPYYEDLATGEHILPWVRLHAIKDYWGMVALADEFPGIRITFNLVPSLLVQLEAFAEERAQDRHLGIGLKPADLLTADERDFLVANGFHASVDRAIRPHARYAELFAKRFDPQAYGVEDLRDLQVWHKLVWMDPDWLRTDPRLQRLLTTGRGFTEDDKRVLREVEVELLRAVIPAYRAAAQSGRIELSTSPFYHPILPLLCDSDTHFRAHPHSSLPRELFRHPDDASEQLARAFDLHRRLFDETPRGVWPSEGAVSDEVIVLLARAGARWSATDEEILARSLGRRITPDDLYRPYRVGVEAAAVPMVFRDHQLSDLIGFAYQSWQADAAVTDFLNRVREAGRQFHATSGEDALITVILDGENAWEHYPGGGRPFLRGLYQALQDAPDITTVTISEATAPAGRSLPSIFPGSWINGDLYIWAGHADDHRAWAQLAAAHHAFGQQRASLSPDARAQAAEELLIAEGSDWFWWYGDDHSSDHDRDFDALFRRHVRNVYRAIGRPAPDDLHLTNITTATLPAGPLELGILSSPVLDGRSANFARWAASVDVPLGGGGSTMHRVSGHLVRRLRLAADSQALYFLVEGPELIDRLRTAAVSLAVLDHRPGAGRVTPVWHVVEVATAALPFDRLQIGDGERLRVSLLVLDANGQVLEQQPAVQPIEIEVPTAAHDARRWLV